MTHAVRGVLASGVVDVVVVTAPAGHEACVREALDMAGSEVPVRCVPGGTTRQASVAAGLAALPDDVDVVLVHDAARSLTPPDVVARVVAAVRAGAAAVVPVVPVTDSVVALDGPDGPGGTPSARPVDRGLLRAVQTPQGFDRALLDRAHAAARDRAGDEATAATDDASLCAAIGVPVSTVEGHVDALKITTARDLALAQLVLRERRGRTDEVREHEGVR